MACLRLVLIKLLYPIIHRIGMYLLPQPVHAVQEYQVKQEYDDRLQHNERKIDHQVVPDEQRDIDVRKVLPDVYSFGKQKSDEQKIQQEQDIELSLLRLTEWGAGIVFAKDSQALAYE